MNDSCSSLVSKVSDPFDTFVSKLRQLAATCEYGELQDQLIRDRIVIGLNDQAQRARLLREKDLTPGEGNFAMQK